MQINSIHIFHNQTSSKHSYTGNLNCAAIPQNTDYDSVSFSGAKKRQNVKTLKKLKHFSTSNIQIPNLDIMEQNKLKQQQRNAQKAAIRTQKELQLAEEALNREHRKNELKMLVTESTKEAILAHTISDKKLSLLIDKLSEFPELLDELFFNGGGGGLVCAVSDEIAAKILKNSPYPSMLLKLTLTKDKNGQLFMEKASTAKIKSFNEVARNMPSVLTQTYTKKNKQKQIPAHYLPPAALESMNEVIANNHNLINTIYLSLDENKNTPAHNRFRKGMNIILDTLKQHPQTLNQLEKIKNNFGEHYDSALKAAENYNGPFDATWEYILNNY